MSAMTIPQGVAMSDVVGASLNGNTGCDARGTVYEGSQAQEDFVVRELWTARQNLDKLQAQYDALQAEFEAQSMTLAAVEHEKSMLESRQAGSSTAQSQALIQEQQKVAELQAAYDSQSQNLAEVEGERLMLMNQVKELEAGIAADEAELAVAVQEMDRQMLEMEERAVAAEAALQRERQEGKHRLAQQALETADFE
eukprot:CAMPEP_0118942948 /NCGR_PEP_ID=MMETSP1169-20130426/37210_1 /TAXON_ID=36882 /ORGANISM="Pyramimonas obovata, Strain CCMP722" /LENGTH=196 /DNA_ID=CAMNT_0006888071 /DNA_START=111 /DNA_END=698 /DNA_ORIENTATION=-